MTDGPGLIPTPPRSPLLETDRIWECGFLIAAAVLVIWQLFVPPALSVANNNDFQKLGGPVCIGYDPRVGNELFNYASLHWRYSLERCADWPFHTSVQLVLQGAIVLDRLFRLLPEFDLRWMGAVYTVVFLAALVWAQRVLRPLRPKTSRTLQIAFLVVVCNAVYIPMFNTFYFDTLALVLMPAALVGIGAILMKERVATATLLVTAGVMALIAAAKGQHAPLALICLPALWMSRGRITFPPVWARAAGSLVVLLGANVSLSSIPPYYAGQATFNSLFFAILPTVSNPASYLAETRIPASYPSQAAIGKHSFQPDSPNFTEQQEIAFGRMFGLRDLVLLYLRHPDRAWYMMMVHLDGASRDRVGTPNLNMGLGNYERSTGVPPRGISHFFGLWPALKNGAIGGRPLVYLLYICTVIAAAWLLAPRREGMFWFLLIGTCLLAVSMGIAMLDGLDSSRHMQMFNYLLDLTVCGIAACAVERIA